MCVSLRRLGVPPADVEDAAQEVFVIVHRRQADIDPTRAVRYWIFGICVNVARSTQRKTRRRRESPPGEIENVPDVAPLPDEHLVRLEDHSFLMKALATLDFERRSVFVMHTLSECSVATIAEALSIPINTVYSRLRVARGEFERAVHRLRLAQDHPPRRDS